MWVLRKGSWRACWFLVPALLAGVLLVFCNRQGSDHTARPVVPLDDWGIRQLAAFLNDEGLGLRLVVTGNDAACPNAFMTTTNKGWEELNGLVKHPERIGDWQGVLYCEHAQGLQATWPSMTPHWGGCCLVVGPFLFFGDKQLLGRVRAALTGTRRQTALAIKPKPPRTAPSFGLRAGGTGPLILSQTASCKEQDHATSCLAETADGGGGPNRPRRTRRPAPHGRPRLDATYNSASPFEVGEVTLSGSSASGNTVCITWR